MIFIYHALIRLPWLTIVRGIQFLDHAICFAQINPCNASPDNFISQPNQSKFQRITCNFSRICYDRNVQNISPISAVIGLYSFKYFGSE
jgi:hypothetical protein